MKVVIPYKPQPRQVVYHKAKADEILYGGAAGGGKSEATIMDALKYGMKYEGSRQIIFRRTFPDLQRSIISRTLQVYPKEIAKYNSAKHEWTLINSSVIELAYWDNDSNYMNYQGAEYDVIRWEELTQFEERWYLYMLSRLRGSRPYPRSVKSTTNPGGVGHSWVKTRFIDVGPSEQVHTLPVTDDSGNQIYHPLTGEPVVHTVMFIPATIHDNQALIQNDPGYLIRLMSLSDQERKQLLDGDWDTFTGQYFSEFNRAIHVIEPFVIPDHWKRYTASDYGLDMLATYWIAIDPQGNAYVYKELYESNRIISEAAKRMKEVNHEDDVHSWYAPPDLWNRRQETGKSAAELFRENGVMLRKTNNNRVQGWYNVKEWIKPIKLRDEQTGEIILTSRLKIFSNCVNLIRTLPMLRHDEKNPNDVATEPHEITHAPDALRYFCSTRPINGALPIEHDPDNLTPAEKHTKAIKQLTGGQPKINAFTRW
jgi:Terminase large subunit, T4likevirus-type, N-terminal